MPHIETFIKVVFYLMYAGIISAVVSVTARVILDLNPRLECFLLGEKHTKRRHH